MLLDYAHITPSSELTDLKREPTIRGELKLPEKAATYSNLYWYLITKRCIDKEIVYKLTNEKKIFQDIKRNCVFVAFDKDNKPRYASARGTGVQNFKGDLVNSDKSYPFEMKGSNARLFVFEAPIDAMSHATLLKKAGVDWKIDNRISLGGLSEAALDRYLSENLHIKQIVFGLDNDFEARHPITKELTNHGQEAVKRMAAKYSVKGYDVKRILPHMPYKDFNAELTARSQEEMLENTKEDMTCEPSA